MSLLERFLAGFWMIAYAPDLREVLQAGRRYQTIDKDVGMGWFVVSCGQKAEKERWRRPQTMAGHGRRSQVNRQQGQKFDFEGRKEEKGGAGEGGEGQEERYFFGGYGGEEKEGSTSIRGEEEARCGMGEYDRGRKGT